MGCEEDGLGESIRSEVARWVEDKEGIVRKREKYNRQRKEREEKGEKTRELWKSYWDLREEQRREEKCHKACMTIYTRLVEKATARKKYVDRQRIGIIMRVGKGVQKNEIAAAIDASVGTGIEEAKKGIGVLGLEEDHRLRKLKMANMRGSWGVSKSPGMDVAFLQVMNDGSGEKIRRDLFALWEAPPLIPPIEGMLHGVGMCVE